MKKNIIKAACIQMCSSTNITENLQAAKDLISEAAKEGAELIITPEMTTLLDRRSGQLLKKSRREEEDSSLPIFSDLAKELNINLVIGSMPIKINPEKCVNRAYFIDREGKIKAHYDKIHLFDVELGSGDTYKESNQIQAGEQACLISTAAYNLGLSICYDLRFPELFRELALAGADIISVSAAFTVPTGKAHWHTLLKARAIESACFILASAQEGEHEDGRKTYGHSLIVNPWGEIIAEKTEAGSGFILTELDINLVKETREKLPSLRHRRNFSLHNLWQT